jgi:hypothetical protein
MMAAWSFWTEEAEPKIHGPADVPAWATELDLAAGKREELVTSQDSDRADAIEES